MVAPRRLGIGHNFYRSRPDSPKHITKVCQNGITRRHSFLLLINSLKLVGRGNPKRVPNRCFSRFLLLFCFVGALNGLVM